jgi:hypothetical protein
VNAPEDDGKYHIRSAASAQIAFDAFADGQMPEIPAPSELELYHGSGKIASGRAARLGAQSAFAVEEVL